MTEENKNKISFFLISLVLMLYLVNSIIEKEFFNAKLIFIVLIWFFSLVVILKEYFNFNISGKVKKYIIVIYTFIISIEIIVFLIFNFNIYYLCFSFVLFLIWLYLITLCFDLRNPLSKVIEFQFYFFPRHKYFKNQTRNIAIFLIYIFCILITVIFFRISLVFVKYFINL